jgi:hypothetical protein
MVKRLEPFLAEWDAPFRGEVRRSIDPHPRLRRED